MILFNVHHLFEHGQEIKSIAIQLYIFKTALHIHMHTVEWFQVFLCITNDSINH